MGTQMITVTGLPAMLALIDSVPKILVIYAFPQAFGAAANVFRQALMVTTPYTGESMRGRTALTGVGNWGRGALRENIVTDIQLDSRLRGGSTDVGFGKLGPIANWVEYGHRMVGHRPGLKLLGAVQPIPFMRRAFDASADAAIDAFVSTLTGILQRGLPGVQTNGNTSGSGTGGGTP